MQWSECRYVELDVLVYGPSVSGFKRRRPRYVIQQQWLEDVVEEDLVEFSQVSAYLEARLC